MSAVIASVAATSTTTAVQPTAGTTSSLNTSTPIVVTDNAATAEEPVVLEVTEGTGTLKLAVGTTGADVIVEAGEGANDATIEIGLATDENGNILSNSGSSVQVEENYRGSVIVNYEGAIADGTSKVDLTTPTPGGGTIANNAPPTSTSFDNIPDFYINAGAGDDQIKGSASNDFIRGGAGSDLINAGAGNDIVRGGADSDLVTLGAGNDVYYFSVDQLIGTSTDTITDFTSGEDQVQIARNIEGRVSISGFGTKSLVITLSGSETGTTGLESGVNGTAFEEDDVVFV